VTSAKAGRVWGEDASGSASTLTAQCDGFKASMVSLKGWPYGNSHIVIAMAPRRIFRWRACLSLARKVGIAIIGCESKIKA